LGLGGVYTFFMNTIQAWNGQLRRAEKFPGAPFRATSLQYLGVGFIIAAGGGGILCRGVISWLLVMPAIHFRAACGNNSIYP
jgi:hypothetical protein